MIDGWKSRQLAKNEAVIDSNLIAQAVRAFMEGKDEWEGTPFKLLHELESVSGKVGIDIKSKEWPRNPSWLSRRLKAVE